MSATAFLIIVLATFLSFMAALLWAQFTTPSLEDINATEAAKSGADQD